MIGDKRPVVMESDRGVPGGVATLDENGKLMESQRAVKSNSNLLINWNFANPVNRNGQTEYRQTSTSLLYTIDKWRCSGVGMVITLNDECIEVSSGENQTYFINALSLRLSEILYGKTVTLSILVNDELFSAAIAITSGTTPATALMGRANFAAGTIELYKRGTDSGASGISAENGALFVQIRNSANSINKIKAVKLELGSIQTLAHKDGKTWILNEIPDFAEQYAICSQYSPITGEFVGSRHSNPNLLDNWCFADPINQRGKTAYTAAGYTIDRWRLYITSGATGELDINDDYISLSKMDSTQQVDIRKTIEVGSLNGNTVTLSMLYRTINKDAIRFYAYWNGTSYGVVDAPETGGDWSVLSTTFVVPIAAKTLILLISLNKPNQPTASIDIKAAKLELGPVQTLAHKESNQWVLNDPSPNKALELAKCQRYVHKFMNSEMRASRITPTLIRAWFPTGVPLRANPALVSGGFQVKTLAGGTILSNAVWSYEVQGKGILVTATVDTGINADAVIYSSMVIVSAEQ